MPAHSPACKLLLSILVPTYRYAEGVCRILACLYPIPIEDCELIVFDNSPDDEIEGIVARWRLATGMPVTYQSNQPSLGAVANWNKLLDAARGEFCLLLHHDEFPLGEYFVKDLINTLRQSADMDACLLDCILVDPQSHRNRRHVPTWLRALLLKYFPHYLFRRNIIGPTSALVVRRSLYPRFDERLRWLVDVDVYVRLLKVTKCLRMCPKVQMGSILNRSDSITARLGSSIPQLELEERKYLLSLNPDAGIWLRPGGMNCFLVLLRACETVGWSLFRVLTRLAARLGRDPVPHAVIQRSLHARDMKRSSTSVI